MEKNIYEASFKEFFRIRGFEINDETDLFETGAIDSLGIVELVLFIEEELNVKLDVSTLLADNFKNLNSIFKLLDNAK
jgi:acyl carrier protein